MLFVFKWYCTGVLIKNAVVIEEIQYIILRLYSITNSNGMRLKLNYDFNCCKNIFKTLWSLKGKTIHSTAEGYIHSYQFPCV